MLTSCNYPQVLLNLACDGGYLERRTCGLIFEFIINVTFLASLSARPAIYVNLLAQFVAGLDFGVNAETAGVVTRVLTNLQVLFGYLITSVILLTDAQVSTDHSNLAMYVGSISVLWAEYRPCAQDLPRRSPSPPVVNPECRLVSARLHLQLVWPCFVCQRRHQPAPHQVGR